MAEVRNRLTGRSEVLVVRDGFVFRNAWITPDPAVVVVLRDRCVLIGSHNGTTRGTLVNRDASLIFEDAEIAKYFEDVFWFDWKHLTRQSVGVRRARAAASDERVAAGQRLVSWREIVNGD